MRFAAVTLPVPPKATQRTPAAEILRRIVSGESLLEPLHKPPTQEQPSDLDQRVRLAGEW